MKPSQSQSSSILRAAGGKGPSAILQVFLAILATVGSGPAAHATDVSYYGVIKSQRYLQTLSTGPTALASNAFGFNAFVVAATNQVVTNATVKAPATSVTPTRPLLAGSSGIDWQFEESFNTQGDLNTAYPTAAYSFSIATVNDGLRSGSANFFLAGTPPTPQISNLPAAQQIDTATNFTLMWNPLNGSSLDIVQVLILDGASNLVFSSPAPFGSNALSGTSTALVIPAFALPAGRPLIGHLTIGKPGLPNTTAYPGATGIGVLARDTEFPLTTRPPIAPWLQVFPPGAAPFAVGFTGESNRNYLLQGSVNLSNWIDVTMTNSPTGSGVMTDAFSASFTNRFYRIKVLP
jgi:hypothetical protein